MTRPLFAMAEIVARLLAYLGGAVLIAITAMTCLSIIGRALIPLDIGLGSIRGVYDYTEIGMAIAVFAFLPWCQWARGHASVDLLQPVLGGVFNRLLDLLFDLGMTAVAAVGAWRLWLGMLDKMRYGETTLIAQVPVWWGYAASLVGALAFVFVAVVCVIRSLVALRQGRDTPKDLSHV